MSKSKDRKSKKEDKQSSDSEEAEYVVESIENRRVKSGKVT